MKRGAITISLLVLLCGSLWIGEAVAGPGIDGDYLLDEQNPYPAYAGDRYIGYNAMLPSRTAVYDHLGQFVNYGGYGLRWSEIRDRYTQEKIDAGLGVDGLSAQSGVIQQNNFFNFLSVVRQSYGGEYMSMSLGRNMSSAFTPLVFSHMTYGGLRVDYGSPRQDLTFLLSRGGSLEASLLFSRLRGDRRGFDELSPVIVTGANWNGHFGALDVGASFFRQLQSNIKSKPGSLVRGDVPYPEIRSPRVLKVRVTDDSPRDLGGVAVYDAHIFLKALVDSVEVFYTSSREQADATGFVYRADLRADFAAGRDRGDRYEANGIDEQIVIVFNLESLYNIEPRTVVVEAEIELLVDGDYRIGMRQIYDFEMPDGSIDANRTWPFSPVEGDVSMDQFQDYLGQDERYFTVRRSNDSPAMGTGPKVVRFKHAIPTAQSFYALNANWLTEHFHLKGEFVLNPQDFKFPTDKGKRLGETAKAGYVTLLGKMGNKGNIAAEVFRIEPTYGGWYDSRRGGLLLHTDLREVVQGVYTRSVTQEFRFFDDNDDHDNWPDDYPGNADILYMPRGAFERPTFQSARPEGGVYPGLDMDGDFILDHDRNRNGVEDYLEPFFGYDSDPPEFVYGFDLNNNLVPDFRENDDEPDYPYRRDQQGVHLFYDMTRRPWWLSLTRIGWYRSKEMVGGHDMSVAYARMGLRSETPEFWLSFRNDLKRVRDDIPDDVYRVVPIFVPDRFPTRDEIAANQLYNHPGRPPTPDFLPMRNSLVNTVNVDSRWMPSGSVQISNTFKYLLNRKLDDEDREGNPLQKAETLHNFSLVNKASYTREVLPKLSVTARVKHLLAKWDEGSYVPVDTLKTYEFLKPVEEGDGTIRLDTVAVAESEASWSFITPELLVSYALTSGTRIEFGQHGLFLPFLRSHFIDRKISANSYAQNISLLQLTMEGPYGGYRMVSNVGLRWENVDLNKHALGEDIDFTTFFVDVIFSPE